MRTRAMSKLVMRPKSETCCRSVGMGTDNQQASTLRMIIVSGSLNERQNRCRAFLDEHAVELLRQQAASVVDDELQLFRADVDRSGLNCVGILVRRRPIDGSDEFDSEGAVVVDVPQCADDRRPIERAHSTCHPVVVGQVEVVEPRADSADRLEEIDFLDVHVEAVETNANACSPRVMKCVSKRFSGSMAITTPALVACSWISFRPSTAHVHSSSGVP